MAYAGSMSWFEQIPTATALVIARKGEAEYWTGEEC